jgi:hypothetical protein
MKFIIIDDRLEISENIKQISDSAISDEKIIEYFDDLEKHSQQFIEYDVKIPKSYKKFIKVPYVKRGFQNSCSECSAEMITRFWQLKDWNQFRLHNLGYMTLEGKIAEGDKGLVAFFKRKDLIDVNNKKIEFRVVYFNKFEEKDSKPSDYYEKLKGYLKDGIPVIIRITTNPPIATNFHTVVLTGFDEKGFYFNDNDRGMTLKFKYKSKDKDFSFEDVWIKKFLAVYPKNFKRGKKDE